MINQNQKSLSPKILIAEDEEHIAKLVKFKLSKAGYSVTIAKNGKEAIESLGREPWALIILDVMMPFYDGWEVLQVLRTSPWYGIPVLMLTAKSHQSDITNAADLGATQFLRKPFDPAELQKRVDGLIRKGET